MVNVDTLGKATKTQILRAAVYAGTILIAVLAAMFNMSTGTSTVVLEGLVASGIGIVSFWICLAACVNEHALNEHREILEGIKRIGILVLAPDGSVTEWSRGAETLTGYSKAEVVGRGFDVLSTEEDIANKVCENALRLARGNGFHEEWGWRVRQDGTKFWAVTAISSLWRQDGTLRGYSVMFRDSTVRRISEDMLRDSKELFESVFNSTEDIIFVKDLHHRYQMVNAAAALFIGRSAREIIGSTDIDLFAADIAHANMLADRATVESGEVQVFESADFDSGKMGKREFLVHRRPWRDHDGNIKGVIVIGTDITDRKTRESHALALTLYRSLFDDAPIAYHEIDLDGIITRVNRAECKLLGRDKKDLVGTSVWQLIASEQRMDAKRLFEARVAADVTDIAPNRRTYLRPDGSRIEVRAYTKRITDAEGTVTGIRTALIPMEDAEAGIDANIAYAVGLS